MKPKNIYENRVIELERLMALIFNKHEEFAANFDPEEKSQLGEELLSLVKAFKYEYIKINRDSISPSFNERLDEVIKGFKDYE